MIDDGPGYRTGICEPSIAIDPSAPNIVYAAAVLDEFYQSADSGKTWTASTMESPYGVWGDPCLVVDTTGRVYYFHLSDIDGTNWRSKNMLDRIVCQTKENYDAPFTEGSFTTPNGKKQDKEWAAVNPANGNVAMSWTQFDAYNDASPKCKSQILFVESADGGSSWSQPLSISEIRGDCLDDDETTEGAVPAYGINGSLHVCFSHEGNIYVVNKIEDTWETVKVAQQDAGWAQSYKGFSRANGMPVLVTDHCKTSPNYGRLYLLWGDQNTETGGEIYLCYSDDNGQNWSTPESIVAAKDNSDQFLPWLAVDPTSGYLYAVYYDREGLQGVSTNTTMAISRDGGQTWEHIQLNEKAFHPTDRTFMGDYNNISAFGGVVRPIWTEYESGVKSIWTYLYTETL